MDAPENIFFVINIVEHQCDQEIVTLIVSEININITVGKYDLTKLLCIWLKVFPSFSIQKQIWSLSYSIIVYFILKLWIS